MTTPYSRPAPLRVRCVATCRSQKALTFVRNNNKIHVGTYKITTFCALTDGETVYLSVRNGSNPEFEEGQSYVVKNFTLSHKYGRPCLFVNQTTIKFKTTPLAITEEAKKAAKEALCPPSPLKTGEEGDIFNNRSYLSLQGQIEKVEVARMTRGQVPILDLRIKCGSTVHDFSRQIQEEELEIIGVSEKNDKLILLDSRLDDYAVPAHFYAGDPDDLVNQLPIKMKVRHIQRHVLNIECMDSPKSEGSLNLLQNGASLDPGQSGESLDPIQAAASLDPGQSGESPDGDMASLDPAESMESLDPFYC